VVMRVMRLLVVAVAIGALAAIVVPEAQALRFADSPCPEGDGGVIRVCPGATVGQPYALTLSGEGGCGPALPYQYRFLNGALPPGISLSPEGHLRGTPTSAGTWDFWLELSDQDPPSASWCFPAKSEREFRLRVAAPVATVGSQYSFAFGAGDRPWSLAAGTLPPGLDLDPMGIIAGVPSSTGAFPLVFTSVDDTGRESRIDFTLTVYPRLTVIAARVAPARAGQAVRIRVRTQGAVGVVGYKVVSGRFPVGVRLDTAAGVIRGTPRKAGVYRITIQALDSLGRAATGAIVLTVRKATPKS
jgi:large repetitive protein